MVSVIIPAYNAEKTIRKCLEPLMSQDYAEEYEVIVVDDGSTDSTPHMVSEFNKVRLIKQENAGPAAARNKGAAEAEGEILLFTDADCVPEHNWISEMLKPFNENKEVIGVKGRYKTNQKEIVARFVQLEYEDKYNYMLKNKYIDFIDTYSAGFKKESFLEMGGYDTEFPVACAEDVELSYRLSNKGYKMVFNPDAIVYHTHPNRLLDYLKKKYKFAFWRMLTLKKNPNKATKDSHTPQIMKIQVLFPPVIFGSVVLAAIHRSFLFFFLFLLTLFVFTTLSFAFKAYKSDLTIGLLSPILLFFRGSAQFFGILGGIVCIIRKKLRDKKKCRKI